MTAEPRRPRRGSYLLHEAHAIARIFDAECQRLGEAGYSGDELVTMTIGALLTKGTVVHPLDARPVSSPEPTDEWRDEIVEVTPGVFPADPYVDSELAAAIAVGILTQAGVDVSAMAESGRIPDWKGEKLVRRVTPWRLSAARSEGDEGQ